MLIYRVAELFHDLAVPSNFHLYRSTLRIIQLDFGRYACLLCTSRNRWNRCFCHIVAVRLYYDLTPVTVSLLCYRFLVMW